MEVKCGGDGWGRKPCLMGMDGDGYNFCGNGWGWLDFPLPCRSLTHTYTVITIPALPVYRYLLYVYRGHRGNNTQKQSYTNITISAKNIPKLTT